MMPPRKSSIKRKVMRVIMLASIAVLLMTVASFMVYDLVTFRQTMVRNLVTQARTVADNSTAAVLYQNEKDARDVLNSLRSEPHIIAAAIYDAQGRLFVKYPASIPDAGLPASPQGRGYQFGNSHLTLFQPVVQSGKQLGMLYLQSDLTALTQRFQVYGAISLFIMAGSLSVALWLSITLQRRISNPIIALAETARNISDKQDFSARAIKSSDDELGGLTDAFNSMLDQIQTSHFALRESQTRLSAIFNQAGAGIAQCDLAGRFLMVNDRYCEITGHPREALLKMSVQDITCPEDLPESVSALNNVNTGSTASVLEKRYVRPDGHLVWARVSVVPIRDVQGNPEFALAVAQDITQGRLAEAAMRESEGRYRQLVSSLPAAVYTTDAQGRVILFNEAAVVLWGRRPEAGKDLWCGSHRIFRPDGTPLALDQCPMAVTLKEGRSVRGEEIIVERPDGTRRNVVPYPDPIRDAAGKIVGAVNMLLDITESNRAEKASRQLAAIVESSDDAIISKDLNGIITSWNRGAERLFGYLAAEMIGRSITILMPPERVNEEPGILERIRRGEHMEHYETIRQSKDGRLLEISLTVSPIRNADGKVIGASKIARDITQQKQAERELERAHKEAVAASRAKDDFLAALSHELRTPLNPVLLVASDAAENPKLPAEIRADFDMIRRNVELEARLIDDLLDLTRITRGKLSLEMQPLDVLTVLQDAITTVLADVEKKHIHLNFDFQAEQYSILGDAVRLRQIFWNVLKNAVKFTADGGKVTIETRLLAESGKIAVKIIDTGIGLTAGEIGNIFNAFSQGDHAGAGGSHRFGGLGLGLAISRMLVELHSGAIYAMSAGRDQGATFTIEFPLSSPKVQENGIPSSEPPATSLPGNLKRKSGIRVLLIEDHEPTRTALNHLLTRRDYKVFSAASVTEARALARRENFDLVVSDIGLPDGDGYNLMSELRDNFGLKGIALTGYGMEQDVIRARNSGFVTHLTKPVRVESLEKALFAAI